VDLELEAGVAAVEGADEPHGDRTGAGGEQERHQAVELHAAAGHEAHREGAEERQEDRHGERRAGDRPVGGLGGEGRREHQSIRVRK
jgi:hypothetical protein